MSYAPARSVPSASRCPGATSLVVVLTPGTGDAERVGHRAAVVHDEDVRCLRVRTPAQRDRELDLVRCHRRDAGPVGFVRAVVVAVVVSAQPWSSARACVVAPGLGWFVVGPWWSAAASSSGLPCAWWEAALRPRGGRCRDVAASSALPWSSAPRRPRRPGRGGHTLSAVETLLAVGAPQTSQPRRRGRRTDVITIDAMLDGAAEEADDERAQRRADGESQGRAEAVRAAGSHHRRLTTAASATPAAMTPQAAPVRDELTATPGDRGTTRRAGPPPVVREERTESSRACDAAP